MRMESDTTLFTIIKSQVIRLHKMVVEQDMVQNTDKPSVLQQAPHNSPGTGTRTDFILGEKEPNCTVWQCCHPMVG